MPLYRFRILDKFGHTMAGQFVHWADDNEARRHAAVLQARDKKHSVEIWQDERQVRDVPVTGGKEKPRPS